MFKYVASFQHHNFSKSHQMFFGRNFRKVQATVFRADLLKLQPSQSVRVKKILIINNMYLIILAPNIQVSLCVQCHSCRSVETILFCHQKLLESQGLVQKVNCVIVRNALSLDTRIFPQRSTAMSVGRNPDDGLVPKDPW